MSNNIVAALEALLADQFKHTDHTGNCAKWEDGRTRCTCTVGAARNALEQCQREQEVAPDLLAALQDLVEWVEYGDAAIDPPLEAAYDAITKAKGEA